MIDATHLPPEYWPGLPERIFFCLPEAHPDTVQTPEMVCYCPVETAIRLKLPIVDLTYCADSGRGIRFYQIDKWLNNKLQTTTYDRKVIKRTKLNKEQMMIFASHLNLDYVQAVAMNNGLDPTL